MASPQRRQVGAFRLREIFNENNYWSKLQAGDFTHKMRKDRHPCSPAANQPFCTKSQIVEYYDGNGRKVAIVHQYLRTNGTLGGSGLPDPKMVLFQGILYTLRRS